MKYISCVETAKLIRLALKDAFPGVKFNVKSKQYSGGASISIYYQDGPAADNVKAVVSVFEGSYFDGMIDYKGLNYAELDGEPVRFGADFVFVNREYSDALIAQAIDNLYAKYPGNFADADYDKPVAAQYKAGDLYNKYIPGLGGAYYDSLQAYVGKELAEIGADIVPAALSKFKYAGNDGYGFGGDGYPKAA